MYCKNCQLEIKDQEGTECPLCGSTLIEPSVDEPGHDSAVGIDFDAMQDDAAAFVLDNEDSEGMELGSQTAGDMYSRGTDREMPTQPPADREPVLKPPALISDTTTAMLDQALEEYDPMVDEHFKVKKAGSKFSATLLLIVLLVCVLGGAGYYYFMMKEPALPEPVAPVKIAAPQKKQDAVLDKVLRKETAAPATEQQAGVDNATKAAKKPEGAKPVQAVEAKSEAPAIAEKQPADVKPVEPAVASKTSEKAVHQDKRHPEAAMEKTEPASSAPQAAEAPAPPSVPAQRPAQAAGKPAAEEAKKMTGPAAAPVAKPSVAGGGKPVFTVLAGSFRNQSNAESEVLRLSKIGYDVRTVAVDLKAKGLWHRVLIGSFKNRSEALQMADDVRRKSGKKDASVITVE